MTYREEVLRTAATMDTDRALENATLGLCGEAGEFADQIKKWKFQGHPIDKDKLIKELGDMRWYMELATFALGVTMEEVEARNTQKLRARYPEGFDSSRSQNRTESTL